MRREVNNSLIFQRYYSTLPCVFAPKEQDTFPDVALCRATELVPFARQGWQRSVNISVSQVGEYETHSVERLAI